MRLTITTQRIDHGYKKLQEQVKAIAEAHPYVKVGVIGRPASEIHDRSSGKVFHDPTAPGAGGHGPSGPPLTNVQLALVHEFGTLDGRIPERSFIRQTFGLYKSQYRDLLAKLMEGVLNGKGSVDRALSLVGQKIQSDMKNRITSGEPPFAPNRPSTIAAKGSDRPLVDTGRLLNSITYEVIS